MPLNIIDKALAIGQRVEETANAGVELALAVDTINTTPGLTMAQFQHAITQALSNYTVRIEAAMKAYNEKVKG